MDELNNLIEEGKGYTFENNSYNGFSKPSVNYQVWVMEVEGYIQENYRDEDPPKRLLGNFNMIYLNGFYREAFDKNHAFILAAIKSCRRTPSRINKEISDTKIIKGIKVHGNIDISHKSSIFIVHGHDGELKEKVARTLQKLGLNPIILHEKPNEGNTIIEKFEKHSKVAGFAIVLLTSDDEGKSKSDKNLKYRARQNVILEMGYFIGKLGRKNVVALYQHGIELPGDLDGLVYVSIDHGEGWKMGLVKELKSAGYKVNADNLF